ncbi:hypothetical protein B0H14DRAFT_2581151 [Mycena olivaceomarginata]|nr:hypothetical protein B0H14DRAFT_2581151 [Mycena olivaceomarginata]
MPITRSVGGQAFFQIVTRIRIQCRLSALGRGIPFKSEPLRCVEHTLLVHHFAQDGYATCDNARNNGAMLIEFARLIKAATSLIWNPIERLIGCLAHVIDIATQKLLSAYSKSPHLNAREPNSLIPDTSESMRDEIGLVRVIAMKNSPWSTKKKRCGTSTKLGSVGTVPTHRCSSRLPFKFSVYF